VSNLYACWALKDYVGHLEIADDSGTGDADPRRVWGWLSRWTRPALEAALEAAGLALRRFTPACSPLSVALAERIG
jgi:hypothetical protein